MIYIARGLNYEVFAANAASQNPGETVKGKFNTPTASFQSLWITINLKIEHLRHK